MRMSEFRSLSDRALLDRLTSTLARDRSTTVELLVLLNEVEHRRLYRPAGYASMYDYCRGEHRMSEDVACYRLRAARAARRWPTILDMLENGRLNASAVSLLSKYLTRENAEELIAASVHQSCRAIRRMLAQRFPQVDVPTRLVPLGGASSAGVATAPGSPAELQSSHLSSEATPMCAACEVPPVTLRVGSIESAAAAQTMGPLPSSDALPTERFALTVTIDVEAHDALQYIQALLGPALGRNAEGEVLKRALLAYAEHAEKQKLGAGTGRSRGSDDSRYIPVSVRREVWVRDEGQCTFVAASGHRCECREGLQFDHIQPVAKGGDARRASNVRLLCTAHNQLEAERAFGEGFMRMKVDEARAARGTRAKLGTAPSPPATSNAPAPHVGSAERTSEAHIHATLRRARARGESPADVLGSRAAAATARAALDQLLAPAG